MLRVPGLTKWFGAFVGGNDVNRTVARNVNPSLVVVKVNGRGTYEAV